jgi:hypothetical protein
MEGRDVDFDNFEIDNEDFESEATKVEVGDNFAVILDGLENEDPFYVILCDKALQYIVKSIFLPQIYFGITQCKLGK